MGVTVGQVELPVWRIMGYVVPSIPNDTCLLIMSNPAQLPKLDDITQSNGTSGSWYNLRRWLYLGPPGVLGL